MKVSIYERRADGIYRPTAPTDQSRLTFPDFKKIHAGGFADLPAGHLPPPDGFGIWRTGRGEILAIRDDSVSTR